MGSDDHYPEERPVHDVAVDGFWIDDHQVTVGEFRRFVKATGTSLSRSGRWSPPTIRTPTPTCWSRVHSSSARRTVPST